MAKLLCHYRAKLDPAEAGPLLCTAIYLKNQEMARLLCHHGADVDLVDSDGWTPLYLTTLLDNQEMGLLLLENNADINLPSNGTTPLMFAVHQGNLKIAARIIKKGARINPGDIDYLLDTFYTRYLQRNCMESCEYPIGEFIKEAQQQMRNNPYNNELKTLFESLFQQTWFSLCACGDSRIDWILYMP